MNAIIDKITGFFQYISNTLSSFFSLIKTILSFVKYGVTYVINLIDGLPTLFCVLVALLLLVCAVYKIAGREGNS